MAQRCGGRAWLRLGAASGGKAAGAGVGERLLGGGAGPGRGLTARLGVCCRGAPGPQPGHSLRERRLSSLTSTSTPQPCVLGDREGFRRLQNTRTFPLRRNCHDRSYRKFPQEAGGCRPRHAPGLPHEASLGHGLLRRGVAWWAGAPRRWMWGLSPVWSPCPLTLTKDRVSPSSPLTLGARMSRRGTMWCGSSPGPPQGWGEMTTERPATG